MKERFVADRYARALAEAVEEPDALLTVASGLDALTQLCREHPDLSAVLMNPAFTPDKREAILSEVLKAVELPDIVQRFALVLFRRHRFDLLELVAESFHNVADERLGQRTAVITSANELKTEDRNALEKKLSEYCGAAVRPEYATDPEVIGGVVVRLNGTILDGSMRAQLRRLRNTLLNGEN